MSLQGAIGTLQPHACISKRVRLPRYARNNILLIMIVKNAPVFAL
jgi:hypothetical protein